jgi:hypothetical protein
MICKLIDIQVCLLLIQNWYFCSMDTAWGWIGGTANQALSRTRQSAPAGFWNRTDAICSISSLTELYDPLGMPADLADAHATPDRCFQACLVKRTFFETPRAARDGRSARSGAVPHMAAHFRHGPVAVRIAPPWHWTPVTSCSSKTAQLGRKP